MRLREALADARIPLRPSAEAEPRLAELRAMYEPKVVALSALLDNAAAALDSRRVPARENWLAHF